MFICNYFVYFTLIYSTANSFLAKVYKPCMPDDFNFLNKHVERS